MMADRIREDDDALISELRWLEASALKRGKYGSKGLDRKRHPGPKPPPRSKK
jgi:hypothetical protein